MFRYRLRTLLIVLALGPPVLAGAWFLLRSQHGPMLLNLLTFSVCIAAVTWLWVRWPELVDGLFKR
jgi:hypothetical protein